LGDAEFLLQEDKRTFIADSFRSKKEKLASQPVVFRKSGCLQELAKSIQEMMVL
jgi:hypothetical protein